MDEDGKVTGEIVGDETTADRRRPHERRPAALQDHARDGRPHDDRLLVADGRGREPLGLDERRPMSDGHRGERTAKAERRRGRGGRRGRGPSRHATRSSRRSMAVFAGPVREMRRPTPSPTPPSGPSPASETSRTAPSWSATARSLASAPTSVPAGAEIIDAERRPPDPGHHRRPLAHRHRGRRQRRLARGLVDGRHRRRHQPRRHRHLPGAGRRRDHRQHPARQRQPDRRQNQVIKLRWGADAED